MSSPHAIASNIRFYEVHRWLNPFAKQRAVMVTPMDPEEIAEALRPHLFSWRYSRIPYSGMYGSTKPWGFTIKRSMFQQPELRAKYEPGMDGTRLELTLARSVRGMLGWACDRLVAPFLAVYFLIYFISHDYLGPPKWIDTDALWQPGYELTEQPAIWLLLVVVIAGQFINAIRTSYRQRNDLEAYKQELVDILGAREVSEPA